MSTVNVDSNAELSGGHDATAAGPRMTYLVKRLESAVRRDLDVAMQQPGLTTPQYTALSILRRHPGMSSAQLARRAFVAAQSMQVMVAAFERAGHIERRPQHDNQRVLCNYLTDEGHSAFAHCEDAASDVETKMVKGLDEVSIAALRESLEVCVRNLALRASPPDHSGAHRASRA